MNWICRRNEMTADIANNFAYRPMRGCLSNPQKQQMRPTNAWKRCAREIDDDSRVHWLSEWLRIISNDTRSNTKISFDDWWRNIFLWRAAAAAAANTITQLMRMNKINMPNQLSGARYEMCWTMSKYLMNWRARIMGQTSKFSYFFCFASNSIDSELDMQQRRSNVASSVCVCVFCLHFKSFITHNKERWNLLGMAWQSKRNTKSTNKIRKRDVTYNTVLRIV